MNNLSTPKQVFNSKAEAYAERFMNLEQFHTGFDVFLNSIANSKPSILDLGCGPGNIAKYLIKQNPSIKLTGIDLAPKMLEIAKRHCPRASFIEMDARNITNLNQKFDGIVLGFCLPYLNKNEAINQIKIACEILNPNGAIYISTMEDLNKNSGPQSPSSGDVSSLFINFHEEEYLQDALLKNGFKVIYTKRHKDVVSGNTDLVIVAK